MGRLSWSEGSNLKTGDGIVANRAAAVCGFTVLTDGVNNATGILYDNASAATGKILAKIVVIGNQMCHTRNFPQPVKAANGIYANLAGGANAIVEYVFTED